MRDAFEEFYAAFKEELVRYEWERDRLRRLGVYRDESKQDG